LRQSFLKPVRANRGADLHDGSDPSDGCQGLLK
jgi:hypothetical protein